MHGQSFRSLRRRGVVAVVVMVTLTVLVGFAALTVDVGAMYNARSDLQSAADSAALAAAGVLGDYTGPNPIERAKAVAQDYAQKNLVLGKPVMLDPASDVTVGRAIFDPASNSYTFVPTEVLPDAIRVRARLAADSPNGALPLLFANVLGYGSSEMTAQAIAVMSPRDIAIVADLSASHNDDSELSQYALTPVNVHAVWDNLPGGADEIDYGVWDPAEIPPAWVLPDGSIPQAAGPGWGYFRRTGWGEMVVDSNYNPLADPGLTRLPYYQNWNNADLESALVNQGYSASEVNAIMSADYDRGAYTNRVAVALGLAFWNSGKPGGLWETRGVPPGDTGNGNNWIGSGELDWQETIFNNTVSDSATLWRDYIRYMASRYTKLARSNRNFRYQFGNKTFTNYLLERRPRNSQTPELADVPTQPMQAVKDAVQHMVDLLVGLDTNDQLSLEVYGTTARHEIDLTTDFDAVSNRLNTMQAGHYDTMTNMGGGIRRAIEELTGSRARTSSRKMIILLTDGWANVSSSGRFSYYGGRAHALAQAQAAAQQGIRIFAVSVGAGADIDTMQQIAEIGQGDHFHASGSIEQYSADLEAIFQTISGQRPVTLIQ